MDLYQAALLEDNPTKLGECIEAVHKAIHRRLVQEDYIIPEEREKMDGALNALAARRKEMAA